MTANSPDTSSVLTAFLQGRSVHIFGPQRRQLDTVVALLCLITEVMGPSLLHGDTLRVFRWEFDEKPGGAYGRSTRSTELLGVLALFVSTAWLIDDIPTRRMQLRITAALTTHIVGGKFVADGDAREDVREIRHNIRQAISDINAPERERLRIERARDAAEAAARSRHIAAIAARLSWGTFGHPDGMP